MIMDIEVPYPSMGYDRAITIFSPEGRILQVEYAKRAAKSGSTAIGLKAKDGVVIIADKRLPNKLIVGDSIEKIMLIDDHIISTFAGYMADGRVLMDVAREIAQQHRIDYGNKIDLLSLIREVSNIMQYYTRYSGVRPFGISLIIAGIDNDNVPKLYSMDPSGIYYQYYAIAIGEGEDNIMKRLEEEYKPNISIEEAIKFGIKLLKEALQDKFTIDRVIVGYIRVGEKPVIVEGKEIEKYL
ncbi:proteasome subunit alpha [Nanoarchaeota archaeon NZ13-N]|nr:MAG: proteasome subunit alpha [Nanoarchaeota archaeon NZ13-N]